ncbi:hypothetical protein DES53_11533 [Roseimicrobium gellanilyticum]|uniref:Uncharacterized protein n=1 Tax=Roseimicrobium gellanilyticum TaxID=748857 RepID=A0A366H5G8_9BACT|nr:hypothetical protein [Roseimicrobium gellanilyticum]RBP36892.1 hypothetical protein DES53_11533 [Roseimicrobium gellanilyticum]
MEQNAHVFDANVDTDTIDKTIWNRGSWRCGGASVGARMWMLMLTWSLVAGMGIPHAEAQPVSQPLPAAMKERMSRTGPQGAIVMSHSRSLDEDEALLRGTSPDAPAAWFSTSPVKVRLQDGTEVSRLLVLRCHTMRANPGVRSRTPALVAQYKNEEREFTAQLHAAPPDMLTRPLTQEALGKEAQPLSTTAEQVGKVKLQQRLGKRTLSFIKVKPATEGAADRQQSVDTPTGGIALSYGLREGKLVLRGSAPDLAKLWNAAAFPELGEDSGIKTAISFEKKAIMSAK